MSALSLFSTKLPMSLEESKGKRILVSACLMGWHCRYDGNSCYSPILFSYAYKYKWSLVPVCPEVLGGLGIPRDPAMIVGGSANDVWEGKARVINRLSKDVTKFFLAGANKALKIAIRTGCAFAVLKEKSPSCGTKMVKSQKGELIKGKGITAQLLTDNGIKIVSDEDLAGFGSQVATWG